MWIPFRIDKWKAKHEAMLKLAAAEGGKFSRTGTPSPPPDHRKLVITMLEKGDEDDDEEDEEDDEEDRRGVNEDEDEEEEEEENEEKKLANFRKETAARLATTTRSLNTALVV